jgi:TDG/mug DNA glycosylase family protein
VKTLPDYLAPGLDIIFVGINPGMRSAEVGHYFATPANRFWPAFNRSGILREPLTSSTDYQALGQGIGFTDVVKRPSSSASKLRAEDFRRWAPALREKLERFEPLIVCFHGVTGYRNYLKYAEGVDARPGLGLQDRPIGASRVFVVPNPSPANAAYSLDTLVCWYKRLGELRDELKRT